MLRKRAKSNHKGQQISSADGDVDISVQRKKITYFLNAPNTLLIGLSCLGVADCDSLRSPTSPFDFKLFSTSSNSTRFPKPSLDGHKKCWVCSKVGLCSIVDSLDDNHHRCGNDHINVDVVDDDGKFGVKSGILFGSQVRSEAPNSPTNAIVCEAPKALPQQHSNLQKGTSDVLFEIGGNPLGSDSVRSFSFDSKQLPSETCRLGAFAACDVRPNSSCSKLTMDQVDNGLGHSKLDPVEIEQSEDYTCVITHGPSPKTTHIFGDCVLGCHTNRIVCKKKIGNPENGTSCFEIPAPLPSTCLSTDFLSYCNFCNKKLEEGKDIYMYRGEKAFCSWDCRLEGISMEEEKEHSMRKSVREPAESKSKDKNFDKSIFVAI